MLHSDKLIQEAGSVFFTENSLGATAIPKNRLHDGGSAFFARTG